MNEGLWCRPVCWCVCCLLHTWCSADTVRCFPSSDTADSSQQQQSHAVYLHEDQQIRTIFVVPTLPIHCRCLRYCVADHIQWHTHTTVGRTPLDEWSAHHRDLYPTTSNTHNGRTVMPMAGLKLFMSSTFDSCVHEYWTAVCWGTLHCAVCRQVYCLTGW